MPGIFAPIAKGLTSLIGSGATKAIGAGITAGLTSGIGGRIESEIKGKQNFGHSSVGNAITASAGQASMQAMVDYKHEKEKDIITHTKDLELRNANALRTKDNALVNALTGATKGVFPNTDDGFNIVDIGQAMYGGLTNLNKFMMPWWYDRQPKETPPPPTRTSSGKGYYYSRPRK
tara:strand:+ start:2716 stop:3243 length:528 start_codon:yes stop_codon:yes gene_type:complete